MYWYVALLVMVKQFAAWVDGLLVTSERRLHSRLCVRFIVYIAVTYRQTVLD